MEIIVNFKRFSIGERGYTFPFEFAARGEPGFDGMPGLKGMFLTRK